LNGSGIIELSSLLALTLDADYITARFVFDNTYELSKGTLGMKLTFLDHREEQYARLDRLDALFAEYGAIHGLAYDFDYDDYIIQA
jgi:hypothetical protein